MVLFNYSTKEITAKIVFYGPGLCGKTTNLQFIYDNLPGTINKGKMLSLATKTDRTLFFDFLPIDLGTIRGMRTRLQLYTVPGQVFYNTTRKLVLKGADGVVFVADSQKRMADANLESFKNLEENLAEHDMKLADMPMIIQFNKRDLPEVASIDELNASLNKHNAPIYEAVATTGIGVHETLKAITRLVLNSLKEKYSDKREQRPEPPPQVLAAAMATPRPPATDITPKIPIAAARTSMTPPLRVAPAPMAEALPDDFFTDTSGATAPASMPPPTLEPDLFADSTSFEAVGPTLELSDEPVLEVIDDADSGLLELEEETPAAEGLAAQLERFEEAAIDAPAPLDATEEVFRAEMPVPQEAASDDTMPPIPVLADAQEAELPADWLGAGEMAPSPAVDDLELGGEEELVGMGDVGSMSEPAVPAAAAARPAPLGRFEDDRLNIPLEDGPSLPISKISAPARRVVAVPAGAQEIQLPISLEIAGKSIQFEIRISLDFAKAAPVADRESQDVQDFRS